MGFILSLLLFGTYLRVFDELSRTLKVLKNM